MKATLKDIKVLIEQELEININSRSRAKHQSYSRAIYCKIAREHQYSYGDIGSSIDRNHATILNAINSTFKNAMKHERYKEAYDNVKFFCNRGIPVSKMPEVESIKVRNLLILNKRLTTRVANLSKDIRHNKEFGMSDRFYMMTRNLNEQQMEQVFDKVELLVKVMNAQKEILPI